MYAIHIALVYRENIYSLWNKENGGDGVKSNEILHAVEAWRAKA